MTSTVDSTDSRQLNEVLARLVRARNLQDALAPLARLITEAEEEARAATIEAAGAGMSERSIAAKVGVSQPTVHSWLDGRNAAPLPAPSTADRAWLLHQAAQACESIVHRMHGEKMPEGRPTSAHVDPRPVLAEARSSLAMAAYKLGQAGAALEFAATRR